MGVKSNSLSHVLSLGDAGHAMGEFLAAPDLAAAEQAGIFHYLCTNRLWDTLARNALETVAPWDSNLENSLPPIPTGKTTAAPSGKEFLREFSKLFSSFAPPCPCCAAGVTCLSPCCVMAVPRSAVPWPSRVALQLGTRVGNPLAVGFRVTFEDGHLNEGCCCGLELVKPCGCLVSYTFAPTSGRCFQECRRRGRALCVWAQALPKLGSSGCAYEAARGRVVDAWVKVTSEGDIVFLRQALGGPLETTGVLPRRMLPEAKEYHGTVHFWRGHLEVPVSTCIIHSGRELPRDLQAGDLCRREFDAQWYLEHGEGVAEEHSQAEMAEEAEVAVEEARGLEIVQA